MFKIGGLAGQLPCILTIGDADVRPTTSEQPSGMFFEEGPPEIASLAASWQRHGRGEKMTGTITVGAGRIRLGALQVLETQQEPACASAPLLGVS